MAALVSEVSAQFTEKDKIIEKNSKSIASGTAKQKGPGGMMEAVKASKKRHAQDQTKARLVKKARV